MVSVNQHLGFPDIVYQQPWVYGKCIHFHRMWYERGLAEWSAVQWLVTCQKSKYLLPMAFGAFCASTHPHPPPFPDIQQKNYLHYKHICL